MGATSTPEGLRPVMLGLLGSGYRASSLPLVMAVTLAPTAAGHWPRDEQATPYVLVQTGRDHRLDDVRLALSVQRARSLALELLRVAAEVEAELR